MKHLAADDKWSAGLKPDEAEIVDNILMGILGKLVEVSMRNGKVVGIDLEGVSQANQDTIKADLKAAGVL